MVDLNKSANCRRVTWPWSGMVRSTFGPGTGPAKSRCRRTSRKGSRDQPSRPVRRSRRRPFDGRRARGRVSVGRPGFRVGGRRAGGPGRNRRAVTIGFAGASDYYEERPARAPSPSGWVSNTWKWRWVPGRPAMSSTMSSKPPTNLLPTARRFPNFYSAGKHATSSRWRSGDGADGFSGATASIKRNCGRGLPGPAKSLGVF